MNEIQGLLTTKEGYSCSILDDQTGCPRPTPNDYTISCDRCIYSTPDSLNHLRLKELIPILLLEE